MRSTAFSHKFNPGVGPIISEDTNYAKRQQSGWTHTPNNSHSHQSASFSSVCLQTVHSMSPGNNIGNGNTINLSAGMFNSKNNKKRDDEEDEGNRKPSDEEKRLKDAARKRKERASNRLQKRALTRRIQKGSRYSPLRWIQQRSRESKQSLEVSLQK